MQNPKNLFLMKQNETWVSWPGIKATNLTIPLPYFDINDYHLFDTFRLFKDHQNLLKLQNYVNPEKLILL